MVESVYESPVAGREVLDAVRKVPVFVGLVSTNVVGGESTDWPGVPGLAVPLGPDTLPFWGPQLLGELGDVAGVGEFALGATVLVPGT